MWTPTFLFLLLVVGLTAQSGSTVTVRNSSNNVTYVGATFQGTDRFEGIKFGKDTSGSNRFKPPQPFSYPTGTTVAATAVGPACPQNTILSFLGAISENPGVYNISEDCLNLAIARPAGLKQDANIPVMVFIPDMGDETASYNISLYDPTALVLGAAAKKTPILYVAMNSRVNVFGYANNQALRKEGSLNVGLLDQRLALEWIQKNIASFGGNPKDVTIFGESDGGTSVGLHLTSNGGQGDVPFKRAILQSGSPAADPGVTGNGSAISTATVAQLAGCSGTNSSQVLTCLRQLPYQTLLQAVLKYENMTAGTAQDIFFPTVDGTYIPDAPSKLVRQGRFHKNISVITGFNEDDGSIFSSPMINSSDAVQAYLHTAAYPTLSTSTLSTLISLYPIADFAAKAATLQVSPYFLQAAQIYRDVNFACNSIDLAHRVTQYGSPSYLYVLNATSLASVLQLFNASFEGVVHFSDIPYVFNQPNVGFGTTAADNATASAISGSWAQFATNGNPVGSKGATLDNWPRAFSKSEAAVTSQNVTSATIQVIGGPHAGAANLTLGDSGVVEPGLLRRCEFINSAAFYQQLQT